MKKSDFNTKLSEILSRIHLLEAEISTVLTKSPLKNLNSEMINLAADGLRIARKALVVSTNIATIK